VAATLKDADPRTADVLAALRYVIGNSDEDLIALDSFAKAYGVIAATLKGTDRGTADVLVALRDAISQSHDDLEIGGLCV
jgi:hypothetical protein